MARTRAGGMARKKFSCGRAHGSQYWLENARRVRSLPLASPRCSSVPAKTRQLPAGMTIGAFEVVAPAVSAKPGVVESVNAGQALAIEEALDDGIALAVNPGELARGITLSHRNTRGHLPAPRGRRCSSRNVAVSP